MYGIRRQLLLGLMLVAFAVTCGRVALAADRTPATAPTKKASTTQPLPELDHAKRLIAQLADIDYERREAARIALMGFRRAELGTLREAVRQSRPLAPSQLTLIREIVTHVYLSGDVYVPDESGVGFLGVSLPAFDRDQHGVLGIWRGVAVVARSPGFASYRLLQNGDVILSVSADGERVEVNTSHELEDAIGALRAGERVKLEVLRQGEIVAVNIRLDPKPFNLSPVVFEELKIHRENQADAYWQRDFAPLVDENVS